MFGSNFPVEKLYVSYQELYACYLDIIDNFSETEKGASLFLLASDQAFLMAGARDLVSALRS